MTLTTNEYIQKIKLLMDYAVDPKDMAQAVNLVEKYDADMIALNVFHHFYSFLPEAENDSIKVLRLFARRQGTFLICATTSISDYLYLATTEEAAFLGPLSEGIWEEGVLEFFGFADRLTFIKKHQDPDTFPVHIPAVLTPELCPVCAVGNGEIHTIGCPVEICPWCEGQLANCDCRFKQLGTKKIDKDSQIEAFLEKLDKKGRIPFNPEEHRPDYPKKIS